MNIGFWSSQGGSNIFTQGWKIWANPYENIESYYFCCYWENHTDKTEGKIGIWIGVSRRVGSAICYWVLFEKGKFITRTTV